MAGLEEKSSMNGALAYCNEKGGILAEPTDSSAQSALESLMGNKQWWIGATDTESEGNFVWMSGAPWSYTNWANGEPNDWGDGEDCVILSFGSFYSENFSNGKWTDCSCDATYDSNCKAWPLCQWKGKYYNFIFIHILH